MKKEVTIKQKVKEEPQKPSLPSLSPLPSLLSTSNLTILSKRPSSSSETASYQEAYEAG
jgi:hypothetical protein